MTRERVAGKSFKGFLFSIWSARTVRRVLCLWIGVGILALFPVLGSVDLGFRGIVQLTAWLLLGVVLLVQTAIHCWRNRASWTMVAWALAVPVGIVSVILATGVILELEERFGFGFFHPLDTELEKTFHARRSSFAELEELLLSDMENPRFSGVLSYLAEVGREEERVEGVSDARARHYLQLLNDIGGLEVQVHQPLGIAWIEVSLDRSSPEWTGKGFALARQALSPAYANLDTRELLSGEGFKYHPLEGGWNIYFERF